MQGFDEKDITNSLPKYTDRSKGFERKPFRVFLIDLLKIPTRVYRVRLPLFNFTLWKYR